MQQSTILMVEKALFKNLVNKLMGFFLCFILYEGIMEMKGIEVFHKIKSKFNSFLDFETQFYAQYTIYTSIFSNLVLIVLKCTNVLRVNVLHSTNY